MQGLSCEWVQTGGDPQETAAVKGRLIEGWQWFCFKEGSSECICCWEDSGEAKLKLQAYSSVRAHTHVGISLTFEA